MSDRFTVIFGTQTGNAEDVAESIGRKAKCFGLRVCVRNFSEYKVQQLLTEQLVVIVCSTTGQGDFPDTMRNFWKFLLRRDLPSNSLSNLKFCVVGLGDSSYEKYNVVAKKLNKRFLQLGAEEFVSLTLCDDQHELGYDAALEVWFKHFFEKQLRNQHNIVSTNRDSLLPPRYKINFQIDSDVLNFCEGNSFFPNEQSTIYCTELESNKRITSLDHFQAVHLIKFKIDESVKYDPGDVAVLMPQNTSENVEEFLKLLTIPVDKIFTLDPTDSETALPACLPKPCTLRNCVSSFWDIQGVPRRSFFDILWHFSQSDLEREKLKEFTTAEGQEELYSYCNRPRRNILEVLQDFPDTTPHIPPDYLFDLLPRIRPRSFSIASSITCNPNELHLLVAVVKYKTRLKKPRQGLCSTWLAQLNHTCRVPILIKHGSITLPLENIPIIMIGPGTGCAPFRGFIQERASRGVKDNYLFFGCRYKEKDFLCVEEWLNFSNQGLLHLYVAFSRDQEHKIYVQDKMKEKSLMLWNLIDSQKAWIYLAGNSKRMPQDVKSALLHIVSQEGNMDEESSNKYIIDLQNKKRLQIETWS